jgi:hypothetical protein
MPLYLVLIHSYIFVLRCFTGTEDEIRNAKYPRISPSMAIQKIIPRVVRAGTTSASRSHRPLLSSVNSHLDPHHHFHHGSLNEG